MAAALRVAEGSPYCTGAFLGSVVFAEAAGEVEGIRFLEGLGRIVVVRN